MTGRVIHPSFEERQRWTDFVAEARSHAAALINWKPADRVPDAERLLKRRRNLKRTRSRLPENQQHIGSPLMQLLALVDAWPALDLEQRFARMDELNDLAAKVAGEIAPKKHKD